MEISNSSRTILHIQRSRLLLYWMINTKVRIGCTGGESGIRSFVSLRSLQSRRLPRIRSVRLFESRQHGSTMLPLTASDIVDLLLWFNLAERVGFEPTVLLLRQYTRFRVERLQPDSAISPLIPKNIKISYIPFPLILSRISLFFGTI